MSKGPPDRSQLRIPEGTFQKGRQSARTSGGCRSSLDLVSTTTLPPWQVKPHEICHLPAMREGGPPVEVDHFSLPVKFSPHACTEQTDVLNFRPDIQSSLRWVSVVEAPARFPIQYFTPAILEILLHPERNTSLILRTEVLSDGKPLSAPKILSSISEMKVVRNMVRRLIPRMPQRDRGVDQDCTFLVADVHSMEHEDGAEDVSLVILSPRIEIDPEDGKEIRLPWYHPPVRHLAFRYTTNDSGEASLRIEIIPFDSAAGTSIGLTDNGGVDTTSRLYRTCVSLLETIFKYGRGKMTGYKKRVIHDTLVPREEYQDLYLIMREKFKSIADTWHEATDASKHVFEDISIATFLMLLWKYTYPASPYTSSTSSNPHEPWYSWGRPPEGFLDLGCGNGLLVHILIECGYAGLGVDLRARKSWPHYPSTTRDRLFVHAFNPTISCLRVPIPPASTDNHHNKDDDTDGPDTIERDMFPKTKSGKGRFIIGNHADELQPWVPLLAALTSAEYLSIPCCTWEFDKRFQLKKRHGGGTKGQKTEANDERDGADPDAVNEGADSSSAVRPPEEVELERKLRFDEKDGKMSLYASYVLWLATLSEECGFVIETEALRIPSTKNRAIIGRKQKANADVGAIKASIKARVEYIRARGLFKIRKPEGDAGLEIEDRNSGQPKKSPDRLHSLKYGELNTDAPTIGEFRPGDLAWGPVQSVAPRLGCGPRLPISTKTSKPVRASRLSTSHSVAD